LHHLRNDRQWRPGTPQNREAGGAELWSGYALPPSGPTGQASCRQPAKLIVAAQGPDNWRYWRSRPALPRLWRGGAPAEARRSPRPGKPPRQFASPDSAQTPDGPGQGSRARPSGPSGGGRGRAVNLTVARIMPIASAWPARVQIPMDCAPRCRGSRTMRRFGLKRPRLKSLHISGYHEHRFGQSSSLTIPDGALLGPDR
jgi:hypothetical protein